MDTNKVISEVHEGNGAAEHFDKEVRFLLSVPRSVILQREEEYKKQVAANPNRRGPKRKVSKSSGDAETSPGVGSENL